MAARRTRAGALGAVMTEMAVAMTLVATLLPRDKVLCRAGAGHEALESVLAACCRGADPSVGCGPAIATAPGLAAGGAECTDLVVPQPSLLARSQPVHPGWPQAAAGLATCRRWHADAGLALATGVAARQVLACLRTTILLI